MDFLISEEQIMLKKEMMTFAKNHLNDKDSMETFSKDMWQAICDFGLLGVTVSEEYGGLGESYLTAALMFEGLGYACHNNGFIFVINNHIWVSQNLIYLYGNKHLKDKYLAIMVAGQKIGAIAITEAEAGSDAMNMATHAEDKGDYYVLNGTKMFISNGPIADIFIVFAVTSEDSFKRYTAFVVEKDFEGFQVCEDIKKMGLGACPTSEIVMDNCKVPKENVLGTFNMGANILTAALEWERCYEFAPHVGVMQRIMERCIEHANSRKQFSRFIGDNQAISHKIADMQVSIELSRLMLYKIAWLKDQGKSAFMETSIFKLYISENYIKTCRDALQIFGAYGYTCEYDIERELRDALACSIYSGTNEMQKNTIYNMIRSRAL
ncbi:acyl-CoA dehydrogenase family protein [Vallitalea pronyensis]|uniref:Acyl-CoA dehydrogenase family protein n=1 Tax=Vallitalea pronyensis TaxID=1348613 RepID=A0A8J8SG38_9FIRM|nr:acyl-CoA dehydrogenase family protein [Vallitalea pronyensis]QUI21898.1 acyl-CoA dehydrogenase family protein [Vallitalea pronyensis]